MTPQEKLAARIHQATRLPWDHCAALTDAAHVVFETFAAIDASDETALARLGPVDAMQARLARWQSRNFGVPTATQLVCGIGEELAEWSTARNGDEEADAVGDTLVYCAQLCTAHRLSLGLILSMAPVTPTDDNYVAAHGLLCHVALKHEQRIRGLGDPHLARHGIAAGVVAIAEALDTTHGRGSVMSMFLTTAREVLGRDWIANPDGPVQP